MSDREREADRLLSGGHPSGARLDRVWSGIEKQIAPRRSRSFLRILFAAVPVAAVIALVFLNSGDRFVERGLGTPLLESTCGSSDDPCRVGEPVHLRLVPGSGLAYLFMMSGRDRTLLAGPIRLSKSDSVPVPVKITPEEGDIVDRIRVQVVIVEKETELAKIEGEPVLHTLVLSVVP